MYPNKNLCILPQLRKNNYEKNYYETIYYPGIFIYDRNKETPEWEHYSFSSQGGITVSLSDYTEYIYGISEGEETYSYLAPLSDTEALYPEKDVRFYGLVRDSIIFDANLYTRNEQTKTWDENKTFNIHFTFIDLAKKLISTDSEEILNTWLEICNFKDEKEMATLKCSAAGPNYVTGDAGINYETDVVWGNIDMDNRQILETEDGEVETVLGSSFAIDYDEENVVSFCVSMLKQRPGQTTPQELEEEQVRDYLTNLVNTHHDAQDFKTAILDADEAELKIVAYVEIVPIEEADICFSVQLGELLHYIGAYGSVLLWQRDIEQIANVMGVTVDALLVMDKNTFIANYTRDNLILDISVNYDSDNDSFDTIVNYDAKEGEPLAPVAVNNVLINKGYYQGELLSTCIDAARITYDICVLRTATLKPTTDSYEQIKQNYHTAQYATMRQQDEIVLRKILENFYEYRTLEQREDFWTTSREGRFNSPAFYCGESNGQTYSDTREMAEKNLYAKVNSIDDKAYIDIDAWKDSNWDYYKPQLNDPAEIDDTTILFVEGDRVVNYDAWDQSSAQRREYFPYDGNNTDGLKCSVFQNSGVRSCNTGAVISLPTKQGRATSFYDKHATIDGIGVGVQTSVFYVNINQDTREYELSDHTWIPVSEVPSRHPSEFNLPSSHAGAGSEHWLVSLRKGETDVKLDNWLVTKIQQPWVTRVSLLRDNNRTYFEKFSYPGGNFTEEEVHIQLARRVAQEAYEANNSATVGELAAAIKTVFAEKGIDNYSNDPWYYTQAIRHGVYDEWYVEQCNLYKYHNADNAWEDDLRHWMDLWHIEPQVRSSLGIKDANGDTFTDRIFCSMSANTDLRVYVFGPDGLYSRKVYSRDAQGKYTLTNFEETANGNVDEIRSNYYVISNNDVAVNMEKYKSFSKQKLQNQGYYSTSFDDPLYGPDWYESHVEWQDIGQDYPWDIPTSR